LAFTTGKKTTDESKTWTCQQKSTSDSLRHLRSLVL
jgi:hypothetical protein